jgi:hypothetical protein
LQMLCHKSFHSKKLVAFDPLDAYDGACFGL